MDKLTMDFTEVQDEQGNVTGWEHNCTDDGRKVIQIETESAGRIVVYLGFQNEEVAPYKEIDNPYGNVIFPMDVPDGLAIKIWSSAKVTKAFVGYPDGDDGSTSTTSLNP